MTDTAYHPYLTATIAQAMQRRSKAQRLAFPPNALAEKRLATFGELLGLLDDDGRPIIDLSERDAEPIVGHREVIDREFEGTVYVHFGHADVSCLDGYDETTGAYVSAFRRDDGSISGQVLFVHTPKDTADPRGVALHLLLAQQTQARIYDYEYDSQGNSRYRIDGHPGAFMENERTEMLMPLVHFGVHVAVDLANDPHHAAGAKWPDALHCVTPPRHLTRKPLVVANDSRHPGLLR